MSAQAALGANVRALREGQGLSQEALAHRAGIHPVQMGRIERGRHDLKISTIVKVAQGLEVPAAVLWRGL